TSGPKRTAARRVASLFGSGFVAPRSQPHCGGCFLVAPRQNRKSTQQTWSYLWNGVLSSTLAAPETSERFSSPASTPPVRSTPIGVFRIILGHHSLCRSRRPGPSVCRKGEHRRAAEGLAGPENRGRKLRLVDRVGKVLCLETERAVFEMISCVELHARLGGAHFHYPAAFRSRHAGRQHQ